MKKFLQAGWHKAAQLELASTAITALTALLLVLAAPALAAPKADLWPLWDRHSPQSTAQIDHTPWDRWLEQHIVPGEDGINRIAYAAVTPEARAELRDYIDGLQRIDIAHYARAQQFAYWVNLYNAATVALILSHYPVDSIRDINISPGFFSRGPWDAKLLQVAGKALSLNDIEHRILRPIWRDPRIHYAVNCASIGCPNLAASAYRPDRMEQMLEHAAHAFVNHPRGASVKGGKLRLSSIYDWYGSDFGATDQDIIAHIRHYAAPPLAAELASIRAISDTGYDWRLNEAAAPRKTAKGAL